ncbi:MAG: helix-turn-helix domain-containing protein [Prevotellaceae bacterium]|jgi:transcriptional regulator with XRE-family HTH domain|nr:helix-turn-helix domain-containing protein [Prevotellaceae bacterium]
MNERLTAFLRAEQLSPAHFADTMGIQRSGVSHLLSGRNKPGFDFFSAFLHKFPAVNIEWLISGRGKMYKEMETKPLFPELAAAPESRYTAMAGTLVDAPPVPPDEAEQAAPSPASAKAPGPRCIEKVVVLYSDGTFSDFARP